MLLTPFSASPRSQPACREHVSDCALYQEGGGAARLWGPALPAPGRRGHRPDLAFSLNPPGLLQPVLTVTRCSPAAQLGGTLSRARTQARQRSAMYRTLASPTGETRGRHPALCSQLVNGAPRGLSQAWCWVLGESINQ